MLFKGGSENFFHPLFHEWVSIDELIFVLQIWGHILRTILTLRIVYSAEMIISISLLDKVAKPPVLVVRIAPIHYLCPEMHTVKTR
jgi:hypothetical protein